MTEMSNQPGRDNLFLKNGIGYHQTCQQPGDRLTEFRHQYFFNFVTGVGQFVFEDLDQAENDILGVHLDCIINYVLLLSDYPYEVLHLVGGKGVRQCFPAGLV